MNVRLVRPRASAVACACAMASALKSNPWNELFGKASARRVRAWPRPQPRSASRAPSASASDASGMFGIISVSRAASNFAPLCSAMKSWKFGYFEYGTPSPVRNATTTSSSTWASNEIDCSDAARFNEPPARVTSIWCSTGSTKVSSAAS